MIHGPLLVLGVHCLLVWAPSSPRGTMVNKVAPLVLDLGAPSASRSPIKCWPGHMPPQSPWGTLWFLIWGANYLQGVSYWPPAGDEIWGILLGPKPILGLSGKGAPEGLSPMWAPQLPRRKHAPLPPSPHLGYIPVQRLHITSTIASGERIHGLKIEKNSKNWKHQNKLFQKLSGENADTPDTCLALPRWLWLWKITTMQTNIMHSKRQCFKTCTSEGLN